MGAYQGAGGRQVQDLVPIVSLHAAGNVGGNVAFGAGALVTPPRPPSHTPFPHTTPIPTPPAQGLCTLAPLPPKKNSPRPTPAENPPPTRSSRSSWRGLRGCVRKVLGWRCGGGGGLAFARSEVGGGVAGLWRCAAAGAGGVCVGRAGGPCGADAAGRWRRVCVCGGGGRGSRTCSSRWSRPSRPSSRASTRASGRCP